MQNGGGGVFVFVLKGTKERETGVVVRHSFFDVKLRKRMKTAKKHKKKRKSLPHFRWERRCCYFFLPSSLLLSSRRLLSCVFPRNSRLKSTRPSCLPTTPPARLSALPLPSSSLLFAFSSLKLFPAFVSPLNLLPQPVSQLSGHEAKKQKFFSPPSHLEGGTSSSLCRRH